MSERAYKIRGLATKNKLKKTRQSREIHNHAPTKTVAYCPRCPIDHVDPEKTMAKVYGPFKHKHQEQKCPKCGLMFVTDGGAGA